MPQGGAKTATDFYKATPLHTPPTGGNNNTVYVHDFYDKNMEDALNNGDDDEDEEEEFNHQYGGGSVSHLTMSDRVKLINQLQKDRQPSR